MFNWFIVDEGLLFPNWGEQSHRKIQITRIKWKNHELTILLNFLVEGIKRDWKTKATKKKIWTGQ